MPQSPSSSCTHASSTLRRGTSWRAHVIALRHSAALLAARFVRRGSSASAMDASPRRSVRLPAPSETQVASILAGLTSRVLLHPVDCIKTRLQYMRGRPGSFSTTAALVSFARTEGIVGLYRGILGALAGVVPYSLLYMPSYEFAQMQLGVHLGKRQLLGFRHVIAGCTAGLCGSLVKVPVDVVKKRLQAGLYPNLIVAVTSIAGESVSKVPLSRVLNFYTGWRSAIIYDIPYNAVQFTVLENVKRAVKRVRRKEQLERTENVLVGALTGMITSMITEPLDVVKTRLMTQRMQSMQPGVTFYRGWAHCVRAIMREEGPRALWKGSLPRLFWVGASSAIWYGTYQTARQALAKKGKLAALERTSVSDEEFATRQERLLSTVEQKSPARRN